MSNRNNDLFSITFIGAGISTAFTLLSLIDKLTRDNTAKEVVKINIIDKYPEFFCGIPYGKRSGGSVLLINSLRSFLPIPERSFFIAWLKVNKKALINDFINIGGTGSKRWLSDNIDNIEADNWEDLFIPRSFFGKYISEKVTKSIELAEQKNLIQITYTVAEVLDIDKENELFDIKLNTGENFWSSKVVLSLGSLPPNKIYSEETQIKHDELLLFNDIYNKELDLNFKEIEKFILNRQQKETNVLIIGSNASALENFYKLDDNTLIKNHLSNYFILSTQGTIPDSKVAKEYEEFLPINLLSLKNKENITAKQIAEAAFLDIDLAEAHNLGSASTVDIISQSFGALLKKLDNNEKEIFACKYGNAIGKKQRCAGTHYTDVIYKLLQANKLKIISGQFKQIIAGENNTYRFEYLDTKTNSVNIFPNNIHLIINCTGSINFKSKNVPILLKNLISKNYCVPNDSEIGIKINHSFEASKNLYVAGPLLAGNVIENNPVWHLEHCGRIIWTSGLIGKRLI